MSAAEIFTKHAKGMRWLTIDGLHYLNSARGRQSET